MSGGSFTDEVKVKIPSFQKITFFFSDIKYSSDMLSINLYFTLFEAVNKSCDIR